MKKSNCLRIILSCMCVLPFTTQAAWHECSCPNFDYSYNPPLLEPTPCGHGFVEGEWLLWRSNMECATWGWATYSDVNPNQGPSADITSVDSFEVNQRQLSHDWQSGFRVGLGYDFDCDKWGVRATYTYFRGTADDHVRIDNSSFDVVNGGVTGSFINFFGPNAGVFLLPAEDAAASLNSPLTLAADAHWKIELNQIDLDITREYLVGRYVSLRPVLGVRYYYLNSKMNVNQVSEDIVGVESSPFLTETNFFESRNRCEYHAFGIKSGINSQWELGCGFGIYGDAYLTLAYGQMRTKNRVIITGEVDPSASVEEFAERHAKSNGSWCTVKPVGDYAIGLYFRQGFNCDRSLFEVKVGWEHHVYYGHNQFRGINVDPLALSIATLNRPGISATTTDRCADISFAGLSVMAGIWF